MSRKRPNMSRTMRSNCSRVQSVRNAASSESVTTSALSDVANRTAYEMSASRKCQRVSTTAAAIDACDGARPEVDGAAGGKTTDASVGYVRTTSVGGSVKSSPG